MRSLLKQKNKRGGIGIIIFFLVLFVILIGGFVAVIGVTVIDMASDTITPIMTDLGVVGEANVSQAAEYSFGIANTAIQALPWVIALAYVMALIFTLVFILVVGYNPHPSFIALYLALMVLLIFGCVIMSNMYQDIYTGTDDISTRLQDQTVMSYLLLKSPFIMALIAVIGGVLMFARQSSSEGGMGVAGV